jgi:hypothetical protein
MVNTAPKSQADVRRAISAFNNRLEDAWNQITHNFYLAPRANNRSAWDAVMDDPAVSGTRETVEALYYSSPRITSLKTTRRRAMAVKKLDCLLTEPWADAVIAMVDKFETEAEVLKKDKAEALPAGKIRELKKTAATTARDEDPSYKTLRAAIEPQRAGYTQQIYDYLRRQVDVVLALLAKFDGDAHRAAPYPDHKMNRFQFIAAERLYRELRKWTDIDTSRKTMNKVGDPEWRKPLPMGTIQAILTTEANKITEADFCSYAMKLSGKIANGRKDVTIVEARVDGALWSNSTLTAKAHVLDRSSSACEGFSEEKHVWTTHMIINQSSLGTLFNQWPTRRIS